MHAILIVDGSGVRRTSLGKRVGDATGRAVLEASGLEESLRFAHRVALALVDVDVDGLGAASAVTALRARRPELPVVVVVATGDHGDVPAALDAGATTVIARDAARDELRVILRAALDGRGLLPASLARTALDRDAELLRVAGHRDRAAIESLAAAVEAKDQTTSRHLHAVGRLARDVAALLDPELAGSDDFHSACLLHDVGKIGVPEAILTKPGPLDPEEWIVMRAHPLTGVRVIEPLGLAGVIHDVVLHHHERWDGDGYPHGLVGEEIPRGARIFSVCDALDAMTSNRPYRRAMPVADALERVRAESGRQFDPEVVEALREGIARGAVRPWRRRGAPRAAARLSRS
jgi:putative two-component system response regulator